MKKLVSLALVLSLLLSFGASALADDAAIWNLPNKADKLHTEALQTLKLTDTTKVAQVTGEDSPNQTLTRFGVWGTDLGSMTEMNGRVYLFGGDTFGSPDHTEWRSNTLYIIDDDDPSDGLTITETIPENKVFGKMHYAKELIPSVKIDNMQMTTIPTDIFTIGDTLYTIYMSVKHWNELGGSWICTYSSLAKSTDDGKTWKLLNNVKWPGDSSFIQTAHFQMGDTMYLWGIPAGRYEGCALMKVNVNEIENYEAYEYFTGTDENGQPQWIKGSEGVYQAKVIIEKPVGEISVIYNEYLGNFVMTYLNEDTNCIVMREGLTPWGEWSQEYNLASSSQYPSLYGAYMLPKYVENKGQVFYFNMSQFDPIYNIMWMRTELPEIK